MRIAGRFTSKGESVFVTESTNPVVDWRTQCYTRAAIASLRASFLQRHASSNKRCIAMASPSVCRESHAGIVSKRWKLESRGLRQQ